MLANCIPVEEEKKKRSSIHILLKLLDPEGIIPAFLVLLPA